MCSHYLKTMVSSEERRLYRFPKVPYIAAVAIELEIHDIQQGMAGGRCVDMRGPKAVCKS